MKEKEIQIRVSKLERYNRILLGLIVCMLVLICTLGAAPMKKQLDGKFRIVSASKFQLVDPRMGITRAALAHQTHSGGWAGLHFYDNEGQPRAWFKLFEDGEASFALLDKDRNIQTLLRIDKNGKASSNINQSEPWIYQKEMMRHRVTSKTSQESNDY
jgi:hypothetical protein